MSLQVSFVQALSIKFAVFSIKLKKTLDILILNEIYYNIDGVSMP